MKKYLIFIFAALLLLTLTGCDGSAADTPPSPTATPDPTPATPDVPPAETTPDLPAPQEPPATYTIEQIQVALEPQFSMGDWGEGSPQVISAERLARDRDSIWFEPSGSDVDLSNAFRYRVAIRFKQSLEGYHQASYGWPDSIPNPFSRDGDYTILTSYYYFNDVNGTPELAVLSC